MKSKIRKLFGNRRFYRMAIAIMLPIMLQQLLTTIVGLVDNIMIGRLSEDAVAGVALAGQIIFVYNAALLGGMSGAGIFMAQYVGAKDVEGARQTFRFKLIFGLALFLIFGLIYYFAGESLMRIVFDNEAVNEELAIQEGLQYLSYMVISLFPYALSLLFATSLREHGETKIPLIAGIVAIGVNVIGNYILIFGKLGVPMLGVKGAAIATVISRFVELGVLMLYTYKTKQSFALKTFSEFKISKQLSIQITKKGLPLLINEILWSMALTTQLFLLGRAGKTVVAALSINNSYSNIMFISFAAMGTGISVLVGQSLGANKLRRAESFAYKLLTFMFLVCMGIGCIFGAAGPFLPKIYDVSIEAQQYATQFIMVNAIFLAIFSFNVGCFSILRAGGESKLTFIFDSLYNWVTVVPCAFILTRYTSLPIFVIYILIQTLDLIKMPLGLYFIRKKTWLRNLTTLTNS